MKTPIDKILSGIERQVHSCNAHGGTVVLLVDDALALLAERADHLQQLAAAAITAENCELFRKDAERMNIEAAAKQLAECMDYPWRFMPERGRNEMRAHAQAVIDAARAIADT